MKADQLYQTLTLHPDPNEARQIALKFLDETAQDELGFVHIIDTQTGVWQKQFEANGNKYRIIDPKEGMSLRRYKDLRNALSLVGSDATFSEQIQSIREAKKLVNSIATDKTGIVKLSVLLENMEQAIVRTDRKWHYSAYAATLFIVRDGEDIATYDEALAEQKINDWNEAKINAADFFFCCWLWEKRWNEGLSEFAVRLT